MEFYTKQLMYWDQIEEIPADPCSIVTYATMDAKVCLTGH